MMLLSKSKSKKSKKRFKLSTVQLTYIICDIKITSEEPQTRDALFIKNRLCHPVYSSKLGSTNSLT